MEGAGAAAETQGIGAVVLPGSAGGLLLAARPRRRQLPATAATRLPATLRPKAVVVRPALGPGGGGGGGPDGGVHHGPEEQYPADHLRIPPVRRLHTDLCAPAQRNAVKGRKPPPVKDGGG